jgi:hypothetical protein
MHRIRRFTKVAALLAVFCPPAAGAQTIYRCQADGALTFSDRPCADDAVTHRSSRGLSIVAAADDLERIAELNHDFIERRRARLADLRARAARTASAPPAPDPGPDPAPVALPWWLHDRGDAATRPAEPRTRSQRKTVEPPGRIAERRRALLPRGRDRRPGIDGRYQ